MKSSNLAERLEEFEATIDSLRLTPSPGTRQIAVLPAPHSLADPPRPLRRVSRTRGIEIRGQGLRAFRVF
jgi:hypothetical protein